MDFHPLHLVTRPPPRCLLRQVRLLLRADAALKELRQRSDGYEAAASLRGAGW